VSDANALDFSLDRDSEVPLGTQLIWKLRTLISNGTLPPGARLPGLREIAEFAGVNINTVRTVFAKLEEQGVLTSEQGRGTFVAATARRDAALADAAQAAIARAHEAGIDPRQSDQNVRGSVALPHGIGKSVRVLVFSQGDNVGKAKEAGADYAGSDDLIKQIQGGWTDFDVAVATPDMMGMVGRLGRVLGPRGLMPNPRSGSVTAEIGRAIREIKGGRVEFRVDRTGVIHAPIGKVSFEDDRILQNLGALVDAVVRAKPTGAKGTYLKTFNLASTMGPSIELDNALTLALASSET